MKADPLNGNPSGKHITSAIIAGMLRVVDRRYVRLFEDAKREWEWKYGGPEPSDACVSVRISNREARMLARKDASVASVLLQRDS